MGEPTNRRNPSFEPPAFNGSAAFELPPHVAAFQADSPWQNIGPSPNSYWVPMTEGTTIAQHIDGGGAPFQLVADSAMAQSGGGGGMPAFDSTQSPSELVQSGAITGDPNLANNSSEQQLDGNPDTTTVPKISVDMQDATNPNQQQQPNFEITADGQIIMHGDPEQMNSKNITVVMDRQPGQLNPTAAEAAAANQLVQYLSDRIHGNYPNSRQSGIELDDNDSVISPQLQQADGLIPPQPLRRLPQQTQQQVEQMNRFNGSNGVDMPGAATQGMGSFDTRSVPRQANETDQIAAEKEAVAGLFQPDQQHPYETIRQWPDGSQRVGRYGLSHMLLLSFLAELGDPPDPKKIEELIKEGKLPAGFGKELEDPKFLKGFMKFVKNMQDGHVSPADMKKFLPPDAQEAIETMLIKKMGATVGNDPGAIATGLLSGKAPEQMTPSDLQSPMAQQLEQAARRLFSIAQNRQQVSETPAGSQYGQPSHEGSAPVGDRDALITKALQLAGMPVTDHNKACVNTIIQHESGWNPNACNNWDSNARAGHPSQGLMQCIPSTFQENKLSGLSNNIDDPLSNVVAGLRYIERRYGTLDNVPGIASMARGGAYKGY